MEGGALTDINEKQNPFIIKQETINFKRLAIFDHQGHKHRHVVIQATKNTIRMVDFKGLIFRKNLTI